MKESKNEEFKIKDFLDQVNANDCIPISLINWQMTGNEKALTGEMK
jgi:hypothetical protein